MKEPILSREEVLELAVDAFGIDYDRLDARFEKYAAAIESALLEKLCGEPIYQLRTGCGHWLDCGKGAYEIARDDGCRSENCRVVYALNRSKA
ncbi:hypothetical protein [Burkholderia vietnamiensis]|uniref:hypothetical protein n=1 Tax=Burkholderia vietnamiensis TaxID=60552 RepID=UPI001BA24380|nr:hypothetical protein [Burkholderia vietnamiensis]MBR7998308.1 hypothetical protein [Burkholderia vietnamiensis]